MVIINFHNFLLYCRKYCCGTCDTKAGDHIAPCETHDDDEKACEAANDGTGTMFIFLVLLTNLDL